MLDNKKTPHEVFDVLLTKPDDLHASLGVEMTAAKARIASELSFNVAALVDACWTAHLIAVKDGIENQGEDFGNEGGVFATQVSEWLTVVDVYKAPEWVRFTALMTTIEYQFWELGFRTISSMVGDTAITLDVPAIKDGDDNLTIGGFNLNDLLK